MIFTDQHAKLNLPQPHSETLKIRSGDYLTGNTSGAKLRPPSRRKIIYTLWYVLSDYRPNNLDPTLMVVKKGSPCRKLWELIYIIKIMQADNTFEIDSSSTICMNNIIE